MTKSHKLNDYYSIVGLILPIEEVSGQSAIPNAQNISGKDTPRDSLFSVSSLEKYSFQSKISCPPASSEIYKFLNSKLPKIYQSWSSIEFLNSSKAISISGSMICIHR
jgi:hypothetical protein